MNFNIVITFSDIVFLLGLAPLYALFWVMFMDLYKDKDRNK